MVQQWKFLSLEKLTYTYSVLIGIIFPLNEYPVFILTLFILYKRAIYFLVEWDTSSLRDSLHHRNISCDHSRTCESRKHARATKKTCVRSNRGRTLHHSDSSREMSRRLWLRNRSSSKFSPSLLRRLSAPAKARSSRYLTLPGRDLNGNYGYR